MAPNVTIYVQDYFVWISIGEQYCRLCNHAKSCLILYQNICCLVSELVEFTYATVTKSRRIADPNMGTVTNRNETRHMLICVVYNKLENELNL